MSATTARNPIAWEGKYDHRRGRYYTAFMCTTPTLNLIRHLLNHHQVLVLTPRPGRTDRIKLIVDILGEGTEWSMF